MQDIATKVEGSQLTAAEFNQIPSEIENAITSTGQTLTNVDVRQLVKAIAIYAAKGDFYSATGTADVIALSPVSQMQAPTAYHLGMRIRFIATADNTGPVTISVGTLGTVSLYNNEGANLGPGEITTNIEYSATYDGSAFRLFAAGSGGGAALPLFYHAWQDHKLTDASYVRADTFSWQDGEIYYTAYNELVEEKALVTEESFDVVAGLTIKYYRTPKNYKIVLADQADFVSQVYDLTGAAWYYILDEENKRFKLPRNSRYESGTKTEYAGDFGAESLPNITGSYANGINVRMRDDSGAFYVDSSSKEAIYAPTATIGQTGSTNFDASRSSSTYQDRAKVNPEHITQYLYFYVGNTKRKETEINLGAITEALNGKVDIDLKNVNPGPEFKEQSVGWDIPDFENEIAVANVKDGFVYTTPSLGYLKINRSVTDGSVSAYLYKGIDSTGIPIATNLGSVKATMNNASQFNTGFSFSLIKVEKNENYYFASNNISRCALSFVPCRGV